MRAAGSAGLLAGMLALAGCVRNYTFEDMQSGFQQSELPAVFANGGGRVRFSGHGSFNSQQDIGFARLNGYVKESDEDGAPWRPVYGRYHVERDPASFGGSAILMGNGPFAGLSAGFSSPHAEFWHIGFVGGWSRRFGAITPMISAGSFVNHFSVKATYWSETDFILGEPHFKLDTSSLYVEDVSWPLKIGVMADAGDFSPYVVIGRAATRFWPYSQYDDGGAYTVDTREITAGCRVPMQDGMAVSFEAVREFTEVAELWGGAHWGARLRVELDRF